MTRIGLYSVIVSSTQQTKTLDVVANNLANASTPGFKKDLVHFSDYLYQTTRTDMDQGRIRATGNPLDIAISGQGMLRVQSDKGVLYTRKGDLTLNNSNTLVTQEGWPVLGQNGPIQLSGDNKEEIRVTRDGQVFDGPDLIDTIFVADFDPATKLEKDVYGYFKPPKDAPEPGQVENPTVEQGSLEEANFNIVEEMARMIEDSRAFEAYQKIIKTLEEQDHQLSIKLATG